MKAILGLVFCASLTGALAQTVGFRNNDVYATPAERRVFDFGFTPIVGSQVLVQLLYGTSASSLTSHTHTATFRNVPTSDPLAGTWIGGTRTLTGMALGQTVTLQVRGWDSTTGATFNDAIRRGISATFTYMIPNTGVPLPPNATFMEGFRSFTISVPEPSGIGLALLGVSAILILKRRSSL